MVAAGIILPLLVLLIIWFIPKQSLDTDSQKEDQLPTDAFRVRTGIFSTLIFLVCILVSFLMCVGKMTNLTGTRVDSESTEVNNQKRLKNIQQQVKNEVLKQENSIDRENAIESPEKFDDEENVFNQHNDNEDQEGLFPRDQEQHEEDEFGFDANHQDHIEDGM
ncbi:hypothetical protein FGO68_gene938 [Halteria grandinella]|uniref:Transmembrane protein n=2 Tax=Halteria grandinella TaxID=5974 RepID=A0A8J8NPL3_HALGN|nr:hypothetical protein FGO68_gene938 [Halteria grandinella]